MKLLAVKNVYSIMFSCILIFNNITFGQDVIELETPVEITKKIEYFWKKS